MVQRSVGVRYYYKQADTNFHHRGAMWRFLNTVAALGYNLNTSFDEADEAFAVRRQLWSTGSTVGWEQTLSMPRTFEPRPVMHTNPNDFFTKGLTEAAFDEMEGFIGSKDALLMVSAFPAARSGPLTNFRISFLFDKETSDIHITLFTNAFAANRAESEMVFANWLSIFQAMYDIWHPLYGHSTSNDTDWPDTTDEDIQAHHLEHLYEINFFGPELVAHLGRERVLSTPGWKIQPLNDGGALVIPEFIFDWKDLDLWQAATQHLGMTDYARGIYYYPKKNKKHPTTP